MLTRHPASRKMGFHDIDGVACGPRRSTFPMTPFIGHKRISVRIAGQWKQIGRSGRVHETCPAAFAPETLVHALHDFLPAPASPGGHLRVPVLLSGKAHLT